MSKNKITTESGMTVDHITKFQLSDTYGTHSGIDAEYSAVRLEITQRTLIRDAVKYDTVFTPTTSTILTLTVSDIDELIKRLEVAKSLIGKDFLIYDHRDRYTADDVSYDFDGNIIPEEED